MTAARSDVVLVCMPYASIVRPSMALGLLSAVLARDGVSCRVEYPNLWFAERVGMRLYHLCSHQLPTEYLAGEWTFAAAAFRDGARPEGPFLDDVGAHHARLQRYRFRGGGVRLVDDLRNVRAAATDFVDEAARRILAASPRIVGCTSTFEQHVASLALLRRIRELDPSVVTMLGGANCETVMGEATHRSFPWVDFVVSGEADAIIADLCRDVLSHGRDVPAERLPQGVLGPSHRGDAPRGRTARALFRNLDELPEAVFDDYFRTLEASPLRTMIDPGLPLETSRGCWWGALHHCTFCGLNGTGMTYRSKSPERVVREVRSLEARYGITRFEAVDNILDMRYFKQVLPRLAEDGGQRAIFYEVKSNLNREQIGLLRKAGVTWVQPGIESLHSRVLAIMDKGVQGWQNLQLLRWAREHGLRLSWNLLWGFPGEEDGWYAEMARWLPLLHHLQAPANAIRVRYDRYTPYHERSAEYGLQLEPIRNMAAVYPLPPETLSDLTYFFYNVDAPDTIELMKERPGAAALFNAARSWRRRFYHPLPPVLSMDDDGVGVTVLDSRGCAVDSLARLVGVERAVLLACDRAPARGRLPELTGLAGAAVEAAVEELVRRRLVLEIDGRLVALPIAGNAPLLPELREFPGGFARDAPRPASERAWRMEGVAR